MAKITKTEEQLTKELEVAMKKLYKTLLGTPEEKIQILRTKFESEIQQLIQPNQTEKVSEKKENPKKKEKSEPSEEMKAILDLLRHLTPHAEIAQRYGRTHSAISQTAKKNGIYSPKAVRRELEKPEVAELPNEELATKMGVYPEDIERIRQELEKGKEQAPQEEQEKQHEQEIKLATQQEENTGKVKTRIRISTEDKKKIIELGKQGLYQTAIAGEMKRSQSNISRILREEGIMPTIKIEALLKKTESQQMADEDLAAKTGVYPETIRWIREKLNEKEAPTHTEEPDKVARPEEQNSQEPEQDPKMEFIVQQIVNYGRKGMETSEIIERTGASEEIINNTFKQNHIWSSQKIREKLAQPETKRIPNAVWARWTGVDEETITRIREELERDKKNEEHLSSERIQQQTEPIEGQQQESGERAENTERLTTAKRW